MMLGSCIATISGTRELRREASSHPLTSCCLISFLNTCSGMDSFAWALMEDTKMFKLFQHFCQSPFRTPFLLLPAPDLWVKLYTTPRSLCLHYRPLFPSHNGWVYAYTFASGDAPRALVIMQQKSISIANISCYAPVNQDAPILPPSVGHRESSSHEAIDTDWKKTCWYHRSERYGNHLTVEFTFSCNLINVC